MPDNQLYGGPTDSSSAAAKPRAISARSPTLASTIIGSQHLLHSALELCQSETSYGSGFVSFHEAVFCDLETNTPWPMCSNSVKRLLSLGYSYFDRWGWTHVKALWQCSELEMNTG